MSNQKNAVISKYEESCLTIISLAGEAKSNVYEALSQAACGEFDTANELLGKSKQGIEQAKKVHMKLISDEAKGLGVSLTILLCHAMDILITAESERELAQYAVMLFERTRANPAS
jgi:PTS system cellobiose-specific IIA component